MKTLSKATAILAKDAVMLERQNLISRTFAGRTPEEQAHLEELNIAIHELLSVVYPRVTMADCYERSLKYTGKTFISSHSPTFNDTWNSIKLNSSGESYQVNYNDNQKTSYHKNKEFYVVGVSDKFINMIPVEHWHNFDL